MISSMSGVCLRIVMPCCWTDGGQLRHGSCTRFWTMTRAAFRSVPISNVTVSVVASRRCPSCDDMYSMPGDAVDLLLDRGGDRVGDDLGAGPG